MVCKEPKPETDKKNTKQSKERTRKIRNLPLRRFGIVVSMKGSVCASAHVSTMLQTSGLHLYRKDLEAHFI